MFIRTFGPKDRVLKLVDEINDFFNGEHYFSEGKLTRSMNEKHIGVFHRDRKGTFLVFGEKDRPPQSIPWGKSHFQTTAKFNPDKARRYSYHVKEGDDSRDGRNHFKKVLEEHREDGLDQIYSCLKEQTLEGQFLVLRDDFPWWKANKQERHCGKPLLVSKNEKEIHPIFFDDNILLHSKDSSIVDARYLETKESIPFDEANNKYFVYANILKSLADDNYFVDLVQKCELNKLGIGQ